MNALAPMTKPTLNALHTFTFHPQPQAGGEAHTIRTVTIKGEPWFVAKDVFNILGFTTSAGSSWLLSYLDASESRHVMRSTINQLDISPPNDISFPNRGANCVSESGLYKLIMRSHKSLAKPFQNWVTQEVLPSIRKTGSFSLAEGETIPLPSSIADAIRGEIEARRRELETLGKYLTSEEEKALNPIEPLRCP